VPQSELAAQQVEHLPQALVADRLAASTAAAAATAAARAVEARLGALRVAALGRLRGLVGEIVVGGCNPGPGLGVGADLC
jgi:hypothetical protein